jgi:hypothetical protein
LLASALTDWIQAAGTSVAALLAVAAAGLAVWQLKSIKDQTITNTSANISQAYAVVSSEMGAIREHFLAHPLLYPYFYEEKEPADGDAQEAARLQVVCEAICDFADGLVEQRRATPSADMDWSTWETYFRFLYGASPLLRAYIVENIEYYPDYVLSMFGFVVVRDEDSGKVKSMWAATSMRREQAVRAAFGDALPQPVLGHGYPWIGTWEIREVRNDMKEPRTLVASVQPTGSETASLFLTWQSQEDAAATDVLRSWVLGLVKESVRIVAVDVHVVEAGEARLVGRVKLRPKSKARARERFLVPDVPIGS